MMSSEVQRLFRIIPPCVAQDGPELLRAFEARVEGASEPFDAPRYFAAKALHELAKVVVESGGSKRSIVALIPSSEDIGIEFRSLLRQEGLQVWRRSDGVHGVTVP
jgi:hypothetical protein